MEPIKRTPKVNDIIQYIDPADGKPCPARVTQVHSAEGVNLQFVNTGGTGTSATSVERGGDPGKWDFVQYAD